MEITKWDSRTLGVTRSFDYIAHVSKQGLAKAWSTGEALIYFPEYHHPRIPEIECRGYLGIMEKKMETTISG